MSPATPTIVGRERKGPRRCVIAGSTGFQHRAEAERFLEEFQERLAKFGLEIHPEKTRLIEFGRYARANRRQRGEGKPETEWSTATTNITRYPAIRPPWGASGIGWRGFGGKCYVVEAKSGG